MNQVNDLMDYTIDGYWVCRHSTTGRGLRLHQIGLASSSNWGQVYETPQQAIDAFIEKEKSNE